ncbi:thioesterase domain-containing protein, partial [Moorena producens]|uniref:thioesterase domain-containing protein n=1 Tax=Moorena producens TaxID=1155739 RepID=UPI002D1FA9A4
MSGAGVTRGYLKRPELNAARFLQGAEGEGAVYRSGDLALRTPDGGMDFVGRADNQVKLRGFRIELGEIESQLSAAPGVNACAVALDERSVEGRKQLVAYVISEDPQTPPQAAALRAHLEVTLPKYMVPSLFVGVDEFPLTSNAKLDRSNLPDPAACDSLDAKDDNVVFPRSASEQLVAGAWARVLDQAPPPVTVDFFDFGGDSLSLMDLSAELEKLFQRPFPIQELVQSTTVEAQAAWLEQGPRKQPWTPLVPLKTTGQKRPFFCVHPGGGNALCYRAVAAAFPADRPFIAIQAHGVDGLQPQLETVEEMAAAYVDAIREVQPQGPYHIGGWSFGGLV